MSAKLSLMSLSRVIASVAIAAVMEPDVQRFDSSPGSLRHVEGDREMFENEPHADFAAKIWIYCN